jgi:hypothetical protein
MKLEALDHPKTLDLAARLGVELPTVIGHLELLWAFTGKKSPRGDVGKWPDGAIARACCWMGSPEVFVLALRESGFIEADDTHRLIVHDWPDHAPRWVKAKLKSMGADFVSVPTVPTTGEPTGDPTGAPSKGSEGKRSEEQGRDGKPSKRAPREFEPDRVHALRELPDIDVDREIQKFRDTEFRVPRKDWPAVWRKWIATCRDGGKYAKRTDVKRTRPPTDAEIAEARRKAAADNAATAQKLGFGVLKAMP